MFILFAAGDDGVACINFDRLKQVLDEEYDPVEWIDIRRRPRQSYRISGSNGRAERPIARNAFPTEIIDYLASKVSDPAWSTLFYSFKALAFNKGKISRLRHIKLP